MATIHFVLVRAPVNASSVDPIVELLYRHSIQFTVAPVDDQGESCAEAGTEHLNLEQLTPHTLQNLSDWTYGRSICGPSTNTPTLYAYSPERDWKDILELRSWIIAARLHENGIPFDIKTTAPDIEPFIAWGPDLATACSFTELPAMMPLIHAWAYSPAITPCAT